MGKGFAALIVGVLMLVCAEWLYAAEAPAAPPSQVSAEQMGAGSVAAESRLPEVVVVGEKLVAPTKQTGETVYTGTEVTRKGMELQGARANISVHEAVSILPGVNVESPDSRGLGAEQRNTRFRGVRGSLGAMTILGIPNYGGNPIGPRDYIYDMENMESAAVYLGGVPADIGTGVGSRGGAIELRPKWPQEQIGFLINQSIGSHDYSRTFLRFDSGAIPATGTRFMGSYSYTDADKWRGPGELGPRNNVALSLSQPVGSMVDIKLLFNYNSLKQDLYRPLTFAETQDLSANYRKDYNSIRTGIAAKDIDYYKYNTGKYENYDVLSVIALKPSNSFQITLKPYYAKEDTLILQGVTSGGGQVQQRTRDIERAGFLAEGALDLKPVKAVLGYHFEKSDMNIFTQNYAITSTGLSYRGYGVFGTSGNTYINSPFFKLSGTHGSFNWQAGLKYFRFADSESMGYTTGPSPYYGLVRAADLDRQARTYEIWLPTAGISYDFSDAVQVYSSYGKNFIRPYSYLPLVTYYNSNRTAFQRARVTLNDMFQGYDLEQSDNVDMGVRIKGERFEVSPTLFFAKHRNLLTTISDARVTVAGKPAVYHQNIGKATGYGAELYASIYVTDSLTFFCNPTALSLKYDEDLTYQGTTLRSKGNQVVDTPKWMVKTGIIYRIAGFELSPALRFLGSRYADVEHREKVGSFMLADLTASYTLKKLPVARTMKFALELSNIFNRKYIAVINSSDDTRAGNTSYYQGQPFTAMLTASLQF